MFRGRKVQVTRLQRDRDAAVQEGMESNSTKVPPTKGLTDIEAAGKTGERETNAPNLFKAPQAAEERETNAPCRRETAKNTGTRGGHRGCSTDDWSGS